MATMNDIERLTKTYADRNSVLDDLRAELDAAIQTIWVQHRAEVKKRVNAVAEAQSKLADAIDESRDLFVKPRSIVMHGVRVGLRESHGRIVWDDKDVVLERIAKHAAEQQDELVITTREPSAKALARLTAAQLKQLACRREGAGDRVVIAPTDSGVDKLLKALLKDAMSDDGEES